jgi:hypothetical protein
MLFQLIPGYGVQAKFLIFYGPLVCFLTLAYLFYIRDALARAMFADLLDPAPQPDPYYGEPLSASIRRGLRRSRSFLLALLPVVLLLGSAYCAREYVYLVNRSVEEAVRQKQRDPTGGSELGGPGEARRDTSRVTTKGRPRRKSSVGSPAANTAAPPLDADSMRQFILRTAKVDDIPSFTRMNVWYIGIFLCAEIAFILMALKEYAKEAMGLTERDLMLGSSSASSP